MLKYFICYLIYRILIIIILPPFYKNYKKIWHHRDALFPTVPYSLSVHLYNLIKQLQCLFTIHIIVLILITSKTANIEICKSVTQDTASVLSNICDLLECDADYLLGRINERTHDISDAQKYTGLSSQALEQLHEYRENLAVEPNWQETIDLEEKWGSHKYYQAFALYLIDELLVGSEHHKLTAHVLHNLFSKIQEDEIAVHPEDYGDDEDTSDEDRTLWAAQDQELVDITTFIITNNIRDIITENAIQNKFPLALEVDTSKGTYFFSIKK